jgi:hypothetical protein
MYIDTADINLVALIEPLGNGRFQLIAIDAIRREGPGPASGVFLEPGRIGCIDDKTGIGLFVGIRRGNAISPIFRAGGTGPIPIRVWPAVTAVAFLVIAIILLSRQVFQPPKGMGLPVIFTRLIATMP